MKTNKGILELAHGKKERSHKPVFSYIVEGVNFPLARVRPGLVLFSRLKVERAKNYLSKGQLRLGQKLPISLKIL
tara:strand:- start:422 stop:646 length:225 start_codon:yes stop_codon:yes gene_type:complete